MGTIGQEVLDEVLSVMPSPLEQAHDNRHDNPKKGEQHPILETLQGIQIPRIYAK